MRKAPEARIWAVAADLEGDPIFERKRYYLCIEDGEKRTDVELVLGPGKDMAVEPFVPRDLDYTVHDFCHHEDEYCVLEDPETQEYENWRLSEAHEWDMRPRPDGEVLP